MMSRDILTCCYGDEQGVKLPEYYSEKEKTISVNYTLLCLGNLREGGREERGS